MEQLIYLLANFGFAIYFLILGGTAMLLYMPKHKMLKNYRISRYIMGINYLLMAAYCIVRMFCHRMVTVYEGLWIITVFCMAFSWMNYTSFLFAVSSSKKITKSMVADGAFPLAIMICLGYIGYLAEENKGIVAFLLILIYLVKNVWMLILCLREWNQCNKEVNDPYTTVIDIRWMRKILWGLFIISILSIICYYMEIIYLIYIPLLLFIFTYLTFKLINFMPKRIEEIRNREKAEEEKIKEEEKPSDLAEILEPKIEFWIAEKKFCRPELTIKIVAKEIGTNYNYLSAHLNKNLGMNFQAWLNTLRVEEGKSLLLSEPHLSIEEIATMVGFTQNYNFSKWFKIVIGTTPFQYRKQNLVRR